MSQPRHNHLLWVQVVGIMETINLPDPIECESQIERRLALTHKVASACYYYTDFV